MSADKVLVTGGAGFIGGYLAEAFAKGGATVDLVDSLDRGKHDEFVRTLQQRYGARLFERDLRDPGALAGLDTDYTVVVHLAAIVGVQHVLERPFAVLKDNFVLLDNVLSWARGLSNLRRFVFASTSEIYAASVAGGVAPVPTPEDAPLLLKDLSDARGSYMLSKIYGEALVRHSGMPFTIVRPHNIYGPRMGRVHVIPQLLERAYKAEAGADFPVYSVDHRRTFCFIDDAVTMVKALVDNPAADGAAVNLGNPAPEISIGELADTVLAVVGKKLRVLPQPATEGSPARRCPVTTKIDRLTGMTERIDLAEGVRRTYDWYRTMVFEGGESDVAL